VRAQRAQINKELIGKVKYKGQHIKIPVTNYDVHQINMTFNSLLKRETAQDSFSF
jgi:hypothetical protein